MTTCNESVALVMGNVSAYQLRELWGDDSWPLFREHALGGWKLLCVSRFGCDWYKNTRECIDFFLIQDAKDANLMLIHKNANFIFKTY